jgi:hypothetical protein
MVRKVKVLQTQQQEINLLEHKEVISARLLLLILVFMVMDIRQQPMLIKQSKQQEAHKEVLPL